MTIKQLGGVFGRSPTFKEVDVTGKVTSGSLTVDTDTLYVDNVNRRVGFGTTSPGARIEATASGAAVQILNRTASDGSILDIERGGVSVGVIGAQGSKAYIGTGDAGLLFDNVNDRIDPCWPTNTGGTTNGRTDLGGATTRFKDLYLSSGVYLGGTAAPNLFDDYEEGTWTPTVAGWLGAPTVTYTTQTGQYTKVGRQVTVSFKIVVNTISGGSGSIALSMPFTPSNAICVGSVALSGVNWSSSQTSVTLNTTAIGSLVVIKVTGANLAYAEAQIADLSASDEIIGTITFDT